MPACRRRCRPSIATTRRSSSRGTGRPALAFADGRYRRRGAGSQRAAAVPLQGHRRGPGGGRLRSRRDRARRLSHRREGSARARARCWRSTSSGTASCTTPSSSASSAARSRGAPGLPRMLRGRQVAAAWSASAPQTISRWRRCSAPSATPTKTCASCCARWAPKATTRSGRWATTRPSRHSPAPPRSVYAFFRQRFAQVTNPPIDPLRESLVMSLRTWLGPAARPAADRRSAAGPDRARLARHRRGHARRHSRASHRLRRRGARRHLLGRLARSVSGRRWSRRSTTCAPAPRRPRATARRS